MNKVKLLMLDRDGTLNKRVPNGYLLSEKDISRPPDLDSLVRLTNSGVEVAIVTNQACISKKMISYEETVKITKSVLCPSIEIDDRSIFICPHQENENCFCRKPKPGLLLKCLEYFKINKADSVFIGDSNLDAEAAKNADVRFFSVCWDSNCQGKICLHSISNAVDRILL